MATMVSVSAFVGGVQNSGLFSPEKPHGLRQLTRLLEGLAEEHVSLFKLLWAASLLLNASYALLDTLRIERDTGQTDHDLPNLTVDEVRLAGIDPAATGQNPRPTFHTYRILDILVVEVHHLYSEAVGGDQLGLYANEGRHASTILRGFAGKKI